MAIQYVLVPSYSVGMGIPVLEYGINMATHVHQTSKVEFYHHELRSSNFGFGFDIHTQYRYHSIESTRVHLRLQYAIHIRMRTRVLE